MLLRQVFTIPYVFVVKTSDYYGERNLPLTSISIENTNTSVKNGYLGVKFVS